MATNKRDRKFMELAIEEMRQSRSEHEQKHDPLVGAVVVDTRGQLLGKAHRGDLRIGEHAEYTLMERELGHHNLEGTTLYVTLEPCTVREPPKVPCVKRIVAARLKKVWIGMLDPNPNIQGHGVNHLQQQGIEVDFFDLDLVHEIRAINQYFIDQYKQSEKWPTEERLFEGPSEKEKEPVLTATIKDFSSHVILDYLAARKQPFRVPSNELWEFFYRNGFITRVKDYQAGTHVLLQVHSDRLVIKSPGVPLRPLSLAKIRAYNAPPFSRNPRIADTFASLKLMEERGWGLPRMRDILVSHGLPPPRFDLENGYFIVTFLTPREAEGTIQVSPELLAQLDERQKGIINLVSTRGKITRAECMAALKISHNMAKRDINHLVELGLLEQRGKGPATYYLLIGS